MPFNFWSKKKTPSALSFSPALNKKLDHKLISKTKGNAFPSPQQLKYVGRFFSSGEKKLIVSLAIVAVITSMVWGAVFMRRHLVRIPALGGEYREALVGEPKYINPLFASANDVDSDIASLLYSGLFRYNDKRELIPDLAAGYKVSADGKVYDVTLRPGIKWSDGAPFGAADVIYTFELLQNSETGSPLYESFQGIEIKKINDNAVRFTLKQSFAPFIQTLTVGILPEHSWQSVDKPSNMRLARANLQPTVTMGPWGFKELRKSSDGAIQTYTLVRNENYYGEKPYFKTLIFSFFPDSALAIQKMHNQNVDGLAFSPRAQNDLLSSRNLSSHTLELPQYTALFFNTQDTVLKDKDLRLTLRSGVNKELIIKEALNGQGTVVHSPFLPNMVGYNPDIKIFPFNPDEANANLDKKWTRIQPEEYFKLRKDQLIKNYRADLEEQLKTSSSTTSTARIIQEELASADTQLTEVVQQEMNPTQTFYRKDKANQILSLTITCLDTLEQFKSAQEIAKQWQLLGIHTAIHRVNAGQMSREILRARAYQILLYGELVGADPDPYPLWHSSQVSYPGLNITQFNNRNADKLLEDARTSIDPKVRTEAYKKFQDIIIDEAPAIFLYTPHYSYVVNKDIKGVEIHRLIKPSDRFNSLSKWYKKMKFEWK